MKNTNTPDEFLGNVAAQFDGLPVTYALAVVDAERTATGAQWMLLIWPLSEGIDAGKLALVPEDSDLAEILIAALSRVPVEGPAPIAARVISDEPGRVATGDQAVAFALATLREERAGVAHE